MSKRPPWVYRSPYRHQAPLIDPKALEESLKVLRYSKPKKKDVDNYVDKLKKSGYLCQETATFYFLVKTGTPGNYGPPI